MSEQDTSEDLQVASKQQTNTGHNPSEPATSSNKQGGQSTLLAILGVITFVSWVVYFCTGAERNDPKIHWLPISLMLTIIFVIILFLCKKLWVFKNISQFNSWIFGVTIIGGTIAFLLPLAIAGEFLKDSESTTLRQMLLYTTGGLLGVITLSETRRKNDLEKSKFTEQQDQFKEQLKSQKDNLDLQLKSQKDNLDLQLKAQAKNLTSQLKNQEKTLTAQLKAQEENLILQINSQEKKDRRDHTRQVHTERRSRYTKAVEQLAHEKAAIRLGGIYTLVGLVDEWLADETLKSEEQQKEGQVIINNLCSYIRSPFSLAEKREIIEVATSPYIYSGNLSEDKAKLREEQDIRRTIFLEAHRRLSSINEKDRYECNLNSGDFEISEGLWSEFTFSFTEAQIFYSLKSINFENMDFSNAQFYGPSDFSEAHFFTYADFQGAKFYGTSNFHKAHFIDCANFRNVEFQGDTSFDETVFSSESIYSANFNNSTFKGSASFDNIQATDIFYFNDASFYGPTSFYESNISTNTTIYDLFEIYPDENFNIEDADISDFSIVPFHRANFNEKFENIFRFLLEEDYLHPLHPTQTSTGEIIELPIGARLLPPET